MNAGPFLELILLILNIGTLHAQACIEDNKACTSNGSMGYCCSDLCLQLIGRPQGHCKGQGINSTSPTIKRTENSTASNRTATITPTQCISDKMTCRSDTSLGICCSGNCMQIIGQPTGFCQPKEAAGCLEEEERCHFRGTLGLCCLGICDQSAGEAFGVCRLNATFERNRTNRNGGLNSSHIIAIVFGVITAVLLIAIIVIIVIRRNKKKHLLTAKDIQEFLQGMSAAAKNTGPFYIHQNTDTVPYDKKYEVPPKEFLIDYQNVLGSGAFGVVYKGVVKGQPVAVKTVNPNSEASYIKSLLSELKVMIYIGKHANIVNLIGANTTDLRLGAVYIFAELCTNGSLESFLRSRRKQFVNQLTPDGNPAKDYVNFDATVLQPGWICTNDLLAWSIQIAAGMDYLARKKVIHADLATRNVLLTDKLCAKITDFGLSRKLYDYTNYVKRKQEPLPWRWMAIESLRELSFSTHSDIWSFGVTLFEIFSLGSIPYPGLSWSPDFMDSLIQGVRPPKPQYASDELYILMADCWQYEPKSRPSFTELSNRLLDVSHLIKK